MIDMSFPSLDAPRTGRRSSSSSMDRPKFVHETLGTVSAGPTPARASDSRAPESHRPNQVPLEQQLRAELDALRRELAALEAPTRTERIERTERSVGVGPGTETPQRPAAREVERPPDWHVGSPPGWRPGPCNERCPSLPSQLQAKLDAVFREPSPDPLLPEEGLIREPVTANAQSSANVSTHSAASYSTPPRTGSRALSCSSHGHAGHAPFAPCPGQVALDPGPWQIPRWPQAEPPQPAQTGHSPSRSLPAMSTAPVTEPMLEDLGASAPGLDLKELEELRSALLAERELRLRLAAGLAEAAEALSGFAAAEHLTAAAQQLREAPNADFMLHGLRSLVVLAAGGAQRAREEMAPRIKTAEDQRKHVEIQMQEVASASRSVAASSRLLLERMQDIGRQAAAGKRVVCTLAKPRKQPDRCGDEAVGCVVWGGTLACLNAELAKAEHCLAAWQLLIGDATPCNPRVSAWLGDSRPSPTIAQIPVSRSGSKRTASPVELPPNVTASPPIQVPLAPHLSAEKRDDVLDLRFRRSEDLLDARIDSDRPSLLPPPTKEAFAAPFG
ncbi:unnamed protein product [Symbiodinium microadriaticum]|nr:unnamed protein product [Symbiodinium microadriaticum]